MLYLYDRYHRSEKESKISLKKVNILMLYVKNSMILDRQEEIRMEVKIVDNYEAASKEAAKVILEQVLTKPDSHLGLATGSTPLRLYELLVKDHQENGTSYGSIKTFNLDEYYGLERSHPQSYYYFMQEHLFQHIDLKEENIHLPKGSGDIEENCSSYTKLLEKEGVDLQLLGIGSNGHIGFNEPGTPFDCTTHYITLKESTRKDNARLFFDNKLEEVPNHAITMGIKNILEAKKIILVACGENKAEAVQELVEGDISTACPATVLQKHPNCIVIVDQAAAKLLQK